jgi:membrane associated rhomboid family serine protease
MFIPLYDSNPLRYLTRPYCNYGLIALTCLTFLMSGGFDRLAVESAAVGWGFIPSVVNDFEDLPASYGAIPENATYLTYAFLHADILHLLGNMAFLWVFGDNVEDALGHIRYLLFYVACAAAAAFTHSFINPVSPYPLIGASERSRALSAPTWCCTRGRNCGSWLSAAFRCASQRAGCWAAGRCSRCSTSSSRFLRRQSPGGRISAAWWPARF